MSSEPTITVEFTVTRIYRAELRRRDFPQLPSGDGDNVEHVIQRFFDGRWTDRSQLADIYATEATWDGDEPEVEVTDVVIDR